MSSDILDHVHENHMRVTSIELCPPHPPRVETPIYRALHERLIYTEDRPCWGCGVRHSDLIDATRRADAHINPWGAHEMESHHLYVERSEADAIDPALVAQVFPSVHQFKSFIDWVDGSEDNVKPFCDQCHRLAPHAAHRATFNDMFGQKVAKRAADGRPYALVAENEQQARQEIARDEQIEQADGTESAVALAIGENASAAIGGLSSPQLPAGPSGRGNESTEE